MPSGSWRCSQCGTVNEAGARSCRQCGRWPSLFDLQDSRVEPEQAAEPELGRMEVFEAETFEPEVFEPEPAEDAASERRGRFPRWVVTAIWILGLLVWIVVNALSDSG